MKDTGAHTAAQDADHNARILASIAELMALAPNLVLPPPSFLALGMEFCAKTEDSLSAWVPWRLEFTNPLGAYQGGMLSAAFDNVLGPLSYMVARRPCVTVDLDVNFSRPFRASDGRLLIVGTVLSKGRSLLHLTARATNANGQLVATANSNCLVLSDDQVMRAISAPPPGTP